MTTAARRLSHLISHQVTSDREQPCAGIVRIVIECVHERVLSQFVCPFSIPEFAVDVTNHLREGGSVHLAPIRPHPVPSHRLDAPKITCDSLNLASRERGISILGDPKTELLAGHNNIRELAEPYLQSGEHSQ